jgi:hypothetical protein
MVKSFVYLCIGVLLGRHALNKLWHLFYLSIILCMIPSCVAVWS